MAPKFMATPIGRPPLGIHLFIQEPRAFKDFLSSGKRQLERAIFLSFEFAPESFET